MTGTKTKTWPRAIRRQASPHAALLEARTKSRGKHLLTILESLYITESKLKPRYWANHGLSLPFPGEMVSTWTPMVLCALLPGRPLRLSFVALLLVSCCFFFNASPALSGGSHTARVRHEEVKAVIHIQWTEGAKNQHFSGNKILNKSIVRLATPCVASVPGRKAENAKL